MTARFNSQILVAREEVVPPPAARACEDHSFEIPTGLYIAVAFCFAGAVGVLAFSFRTGMAVSYGIVFAFLIAFFGIPTLFVKASKGRGTKALSWDRFRDEGIATATGRSGPGEATALILLLPFLVLCWAIAVATIAALV